MRIRLVLCCCVLSTISALCLAAADEHDAARLIDATVVRADPDFHVQGEYVGEAWGVQVMALGQGRFRAMVLRGGLPGAGWDSSDPLVLEGGTEQSVTRFRGPDGALLIIQKGAATLQRGDERVTLKRVVRESPKVDAKVPKGAIVLFDGTSIGAWRKGAATTADGLLKQGAMSRATFGDHRVHLEYLLPFMPDKRDMGRGNSGVYLQGRYEVQIVDSFGMPATNRLNGAVFLIAPPRVPMGLPPMQWQTLDIQFTAPRFDQAGSKTRNARITVRHNGVLIHENVEIPGPTRAARFSDEAPTGPLYLQNHGNPVRFRNVWVVPGSKTEANDKGQ